MDYSSNESIKSGSIVGCSATFLVLEIDFNSENFKIKLASKRNFGPRNFWWKKYYISKFCQLSSFWTKYRNPSNDIQIFAQKYIVWCNFWSKIEILIKNRNFGQKSKCWSKIEISVKNRKFFWQLISNSGMFVYKKFQKMLHFNERKNIFEQRDTLLNSG